MRKLHCIGLAMLGLFLGLGSFPGVVGASMIKLSMGQLATHADTIVFGTVSGQTSAWNPQHTAIYTDVVVAVDEAIKGAPGQKVTFRVAGGIVGEIGMRTSNDPVFQDGEQVIVFLSTAAVPATVVGRLQGKFSVSRGTVMSGGQAVAVAEFIEAVRAASR
jgi:hypothetical protein